MTVSLFLPPYYTENSRITWGKMNSIGKDMDRVCDNVFYIKQAQGDMVFWGADTGDGMAKTM